MAGEDREFAERLRADPMEALKGYELLPEERNQVLVTVQRAREFASRPSGIVRIRDSITQREPERFSDMSLAELYELAWAADDEVMRPAPDELLDGTKESFRAWYLEQQARLERDRKTRPEWREIRDWAEALLAELERRTATIPPNKRRDLDRASEGIRDLIEQL